MVNFERYILPNGLRLLVHQDKSTPIVAVNVLYAAGARDEHPEQTGFAHLLEHLMFEGSVNVPDYDNALQMAGGENNAFTNNDITNYYITIPRQNLETALWLESDRMLGLAFSEEKLRIQKNVVVEEYKQSYINQPYGDVWLLLRPLIYEVHPYRWPTIGKSIEHVQNATLEKVKEFFYRFYRPSNAILVISGDVEPDATFKLVEKWFGGIPSGNEFIRSLPQEPEQKKARKLVVEKDVPYDEFYMAFHTGTRMDDSFYTTDLLTDLLSGGQSSRLREQLVNKRRIFSDANAWISGSIDKGFLAVTGKLMHGQTIEFARESLWEELFKLTQTPPDKYEMQKVINKLEASHIYGEFGILSKSINLAYYELLGDANMLNTHTQQYSSITPDLIVNTANEIFKPEKVSELHYLAKK